MFDIALIVCFVLLAVLSGWLVDGVTELRQIKRDKLVRSIRSHPAGRTI